MANAAPKRRVRTKAPGVYLSVSGRYEIAYRDSDGRLRIEVVGDNYEEAKAARREVLGKLDRGETVRTGRKTFGEKADEIIASLPNRQPRTIEKHELNLRVHLKPRFGRRRMSDIRPEDVARMVAAMEKKYAGSTIVGVVSTLSLIYRKSKIGYNPVVLLDEDERPTVESAEKRIVTEAEIARLLAQAGETFQPMIATMLYTGIRLGEALGLRWVDVDFAGGHVHVRNQLSRNRELKKLKTAAARRHVVLIPQLAKLLTQHKLASPFSRDEDFVFPAPDGRGRDHRSTSKGIERAVARAELGDGISAHNFRHTFASILIVGLTEDAVSVSKQLGHKKTSTTLDTYAHEFEQAKNAKRLRDGLEAGFGHLLAVNTVSTEGRNGAQPTTPRVAAIAASSG